LDDNIFDFNDLNHALLFRSPLTWQLVLA